MQINILFWIQKKKKRQNLGIALKDVSKALIAPDDVVGFGPPGFVSLVTGWRTRNDVLGFCKGSALFEGNRSGREV